MGLLFSRSTDHQDLPDLPLESRNPQRDAEKIGNIQSQISWVNFTSFYLSNLKMRIYSLDVKVTTSPTYLR